MNYKFSITFKKLIKRFIIASLAVISVGLMDVYPDVANYTLFGGFTVYLVLEALTDWVKHGLGWGLKK